MSEKRKLKLMSEVLPDPRKAKEGRDQRPRERTLAHLKKLLALTAGASAIAACSSKGYAVVDPLPLPTSSSAGPPDAGDPDASFGPPTDLAGSVDAGSLLAPKDAGVDAGKKTTTVSPTPTRGYMVVDPLPPPPTATGSGKGKPKP